MFAECHGSVTIKQKKSERRGQLSGYTNTPNVEFNIDEFENFALSRLNVLRWVSTQMGLGKPITDNICHVIRENGLHEPLKDQLSHFIARLCFCQDIEKRRWFLTSEKALFEVRYKMAKDRDKMCVHRELIGNNGGDYEVFDKHKMINAKMNGKSPIPMFRKGVSIRNEESLLPFYRVPFCEVITLVGHRKVYLSDGYAFVAKNQFSTLISGKFRANLSNGLASAQKALNIMKNDPIAMDSVSRVMHIINGLHKMTNSKQSFKMRSANDASINHRMINKLSELHFPLCMQSTIDHMKKDGHLKHGGRMHLGLFLKGIGVSMTESMVYWRKAFHKVAGDKFEKQYSYNIRHNYGKEGKRVDYTPYSCNKIISCAPNGGDYHGCPFKIFDKSNLTNYLKFTKKLKMNEIDMILSFVENNHYQIACRKYFEIQNGVALQKAKLDIDSVDCTWSHPNEYFDKSYQLVNPTKTNGKEKTTNDENNNNQNNDNANMDVDT